MTWLSTVTSVAFHSPSGSLNIYHEARPRGGQYWYAYHTDASRTHKRSLGRTERVSLARLEETARALASASAPATAAAASAGYQMQQPLVLAAKLTPPRQPRALVARERLLAALDGALSTPLTLISASAGWGKTTLLATWASRQTAPIAWVSLDELDDTPARFWVALIVALRGCGRYATDFGESALALLQSPEPPPLSTILTALLHGLESYEAHPAPTAPVVLILDDYQVINGLDVYYEIHGSGQPLVLLPGAYRTIEAMGPIVPELAATRQVIGIELQGHGHTADIERPLRYELLAGDVAAVIQHLQLERADLFGFSLGGGVALQTAIRHPAVVRKVVLASTAFKLDGWHPDVVATIRAQGVEGFAMTPLPDEYRVISPRPEAWPTVIAKTRDMVTSAYDWADAVTALKAPVLLLVGDGDGVRLEHAVEFFGLLGGGKGDADVRGLPPSALAVLPATTHVGWAPPFHGIMTRTQLLVPIITEFLGAPVGGGEVSDRPNDEGV